jgi:hypothetical protein
MQPQAADRGDEARISSPDFDGIDLRLMISKAALSG